jgi:hypothetical protein
MPADPPVIYVPPSAGSPPAPALPAEIFTQPAPATPVAAGAVHAVPPNVPSVPGAVFATPSSGGGVPTIIVTSAAFPKLSGNYAANGLSNGTPAFEREGGTGSITTETFGFDTFYYISENNVKRYVTLSGGFGDGSDFGQPAPTHSSSASALVNAEWLVWDQFGGPFPAAPAGLVTAGSGFPLPSPPEITIPTYVITPSAPPAIFTP